MKQRITNRLVALFLATVMAVGMLPTTAFAAAEVLTASVVGHTSGAAWDVKDSRALNMSATLDISKSYQLVVSIPQGMKFTSYVWNPVWGTAPAPGNVADSGALDYIETGKAKAENGGLELTYTIKPRTTSFNFSGKFAAVPNEVLTYAGDDIQNAVQIKLTDGTGSPVPGVADFATSAVAAGVTPVTQLLSRVVGQGQKDAEIMYTRLASVLPNGKEVSAGIKRAEYTVPVPEGIDRITRVRIYSDARLESWNYDETTRLLTYTLLPETGKEFMNSVTVFYHGDISPSAPVGELGGAPITAQITRYDGTVQTQTDMPEIKLRTIVQKADTQIAVSVNPNYLATIAPGGNNKTETLGYTAFKTNTDLKDPQVVTYKFPKELNISGVTFPLQAGEAGTLKDVTVTYANNTTITYPSYVGDYVSLEGLGVGATSYIKEITADCGTFDAGYKREDTSKTFIGSFSDKVVKDGVKVDPITATYSVNGGAETALNFAYRPDSGEVGDTHRGLLPTTVNGGSAATIGAGSTAKVVATPECSQVYGTNIYEPEIYVVLPQGLQLDLTSVKLTTLTDKVRTPVDPGKVKIKARAATDAKKNKYTLYTICGEGTRMSWYEANGTKLQRRVQASFDIQSDMTMPAQTLNLADMIFFGKLGVVRMDPRNATDIYDFNEDGNFTDNLRVTPAYDGTLTISEAKNLLVSQWVSGGLDTTPLPPYNPGFDGSSMLNTTPLAPGQTTNLHVKVQNTNDTPKDDSFKVFIPIPKKDANIMTDKGAVDERYQFGNFKWSMNLTSIITNPAPALFDILYYKDAVVTNTKGEPTNVAAYKNPTSIPAGEMAKISMIEIAVKTGKTVPVASGGTAYVAQFTAPLTVGVTPEDAVALNSTKNIFRPWMFRSSAAGEGYVNGGYTAPVLTAGIIEGRFFVDSNYDGLSTGEAAPTERYKVAVVRVPALPSVPGQSVTTDAQGRFKFTGLPNGSYEVRVMDIDANAYRIAEKSTVASQYNINSDARQISILKDKVVAKAEVTVPAPTDKPADFNSYVDFGLVTKFDVTFKNTDMKKGSFEGQDVNGLLVKNIWPGDAGKELGALPIATANAGYRSQILVDGGPLTEETLKWQKPVTITYTWPGENQPLTLDANGGSFDDGALTKVVQVPSSEPLQPQLEMQENRPTREGYVFAGWAKTVNGADLDITDMPVGGTTVYAKWKAVSVFLTFDAMGGTFTTGSAAMEVQAESVFTAPTVQKSGGTFQGWYADLGDENTKLGDAPKAPKKNTTYYAKWGGFTVSGKAFLDRDYNGLIEIEDTKDFGRAGIEVKLYKEGDTINDPAVARTTTNENGTFVLDAAQAGNYYLRVGVMPSSIALIAPKAGGSCIQGPGDETSLPFAVADGGVTGKNIGVADILGYTLYEDAAKTREITDSTTLTLKQDQDTFIYYTMMPGYLSQTAPKRVPALTSADTTTVRVAPLTHGVFSLHGLEATEGATTVDLKTVMSNNYGSAMMVNFKARVLSPAVIAEYEDNLVFFTGTPVKKEEMIGGFTFRNTTSATDDDNFAPTKVFRVNTDGTKTEVNEDFNWATKTFTESEIAKYEVHFAGTDSQGEKIVDIYGNSDIVRTAYVHGAPYLDSVDDNGQEYHTRVDGGFNPYKTPDGLNPLKATHKHVNEDGSITTTEEMTAENGRLTVASYVPTGTTGTQPQFTLPNKPGTYTINYRVLMPDANINLPLSRDLFIHGKLELFVPSVITIKPNPAQPSTENMELDYASKAVWDKDQVQMRDLVHVKKPGDAWSTYTHKTARFFLENGTEYDPAGNAVDRLRQVLVSPIKQNHTLNNPDGTLLGTYPTNIYLKAGTAIPNKPGVYEVELVFDDNLDGMGQPGVGGTELNKEFTPNNTVTTKVKVVVTSNDNLPTLPGQDQLATNFVQGDSTTFNKYTTKPTNYDALKALGQAAEYKHNQAGTVYYTATGAEIDAADTPTQNVSLRDVIIDVVRSRTYDADLAELLDASTLTDAQKKEVEQTFTKMLFDAASMTRLRETMLGQDKDKITPNPTEADVLNASKSLGTKEATITFNDVTIVADATTNIPDTATVKYKNGYRIELNADKSVSETYKFYVHSTLEFRGTDGEQKDPNQLYTPQAGVHVAPPMEAYFVGAKALQENKVPATADKAPNLTAAHTTTDLVYTATHPVVRALPTMQGASYTYNATAFVNEKVVLKYENGLFPTTSVRVSVGDTVGLNRVTASVGKYTDYAAKTWGADQSLTVAKALMVGGVETPIGDTLNTTTPGVYTVRYTAADSGVYNNGVNKATHDVTYVVDSKPTITYGPRVDTLTKSMNVLDNETDEQAILDALGARGFVQYGDENGVVTELTPQYTINSGADGKPTSVTVTVTDKNGVETIETIGVVVSATPFVQMKALDSKGDTPIPGVTFSPNYNVILGNKHTVNAPAVAGWSLVGASTQDLTIKAGENVITFKYVKNGNVTVRLFETITADGKSTERTIRTVPVDKTGKFPAPDLTAEFYTVKPGQAELDITSLSDVKTYSIEYVKGVRDVIIKTVDKTTGAAIAAEQTLTGAARKGETYLAIAPVVTDYTLVGAVSQSVAVDGGVDTALEITFKYEKNPSGGVGDQRMLTFDANGGSNAPSALMVENGTVISLTGFTVTAPANKFFMGWYDASTGGAKLSTATMTADKTVYAQYGTMPASGNFAVTFAAGANGAFTTLGDVLANQEIAAGTKVADIPVITANTDYTFVGWQLGGTGSVFVDAAIKMIPVTGDVNYVASYIKNTTPPAPNYTLTFDAGKGTGAPAAITVPEGTTLDVSAFAATAPAGKTFIGWMDDSGNTVASVVMNSNKTLTAKYISQSPTGPFTVNFLVGSNGTMTPANHSEEVLRGGKVTTVPTITAKGGYTFQDTWKSNLGGIYTTAEVKNFVVTTDVTFTAVIVLTGGSITDRMLTFDANGGSNAPSALTVANGTVVSLTGFKATAPASKFFMGWYDASTGGAKLSTATMTADKTVYAQYGTMPASGKFTVTFATGANGAFTTTNDPLANQEIAVGAKVADIPAITASADYTFVGWQLGGTGSVFVDAAIKMIPVTGDVNYVAAYIKTGPEEDVMFTLTFDAGTGTNAPTAITMPKGTEMSLLGYTAIAPAGEKFTGWTNESGTAVQSIVFDANHSVTASYAVVQMHTVTFESGVDGAFENSDTTTTVEVQDGELVAAVPQVTAKPTHTFLGWTLQGDTTIHPDASILARKITGDLTFTAAYSTENVATFIKLEFDTTTNGGSGVINTVAMPSGTVLDLSGYIATPPADQMFRGWFTEKAAGTQETTHTFTANAILYAQYQAPQTYAISFEQGANGTLTPNPTTVTVIENEFVTGIPVPVANVGFEFAGWQIGGAGAVYPNAAIALIPVTAEVQYVAFYKSSTPAITTKYTLTFDAGTGSNAPASIEVPAGTGLDISGFAATPPANHVFIGWKNDSGDIVTSVVMSSNKTLTAQYVLQSPAGPFTVTFLAGSNGTMNPATLTESVVGGGKASRVPTITADTDYTFLGWMMNGGATKYSSADILQMAIKNDITFTAAYQKTTIGGGGGGGETVNHYAVLYSVEPYGTLKGEATLQVKSGNKPTSVPKVTAQEGYTFIGWHTGDPNKLVDPLTVKITETTVFYGAFKDANGELVGPGDGNQRPIPELERTEHRVYIMGDKSGNFRPDAGITRAEVVVLFSRLLKEKMPADVTLTSRFNDVTPDKWYYSAVAYMEQFGIITGYEDGTFRPEATIARSEFVAIASRFSQLELTDKQFFSDVPADDWAAVYINSAKIKGWITGDGTGTFQPTRSIARSEAVKIVNALLGRTPDKAYIDTHADMLVVFSDLKQSHWAYYEIMEAANAHDYTGRNPEQWTKFS